MNTKVSKKNNIYNLDKIKCSLFGKKSNINKIDTFKLSQNYKPLCKLFFILISITNIIIIYNPFSILERNDEFEDNSAIEENYYSIMNETLNLNKEIENFVKNKKNITHEEIVNFRKVNSNNILIDNKKYKKNKYPDISIILTIKNQAHCIHKALRSIQNQSIKNIEIIISIDCSQDNSTEVIKQYMKDDERIILLDHEKNEGTMKTRCDGLKIAKGKYISVLDGDDAFIHKDILNDSFYIAKLGDLDVIEFIGAVFKKNKIKFLSHNHNISGIIYQPELRTKFFEIKENEDPWRPIICRSICFKLIKNSAMQKVLERVGNKYSNEFMTNYEDTILTVTLFQIAKSYYMLKELGYYYSRDEKKGRYPKLPWKKCINRDDVKTNELSFLNYLYDNMDNNEIERKTLCHEIISINLYWFSTYSTHINSNFNIIYRVLDGISNSRYLSDKEKEKLKKIKNEIMNKEEQVSQKK